MWCDGCRAVGMIHCAHPDECGNMRSNSAAAENWNAWLDDLPVGAEFQPAIERLQDFIAGIAMPAPDPAAIREGSMKMSARVCRMVAEKLPKEHHEGALECERAILALITKGATNNDE